MFGRTLYFLAFLVSIVIVTNGKSLRRSREVETGSTTIIGQREPDDSLVMNGTGILDGELFRQKLEETPGFTAGVDKNITMVKLISSSNSNIVPMPIILGGGPGFSSIKVGYESTEGRSINYTLFIYAKLLPTVNITQLFPENEENEEA